MVAMWQPTTLVKSDRCQIEDYTKFYMVKGTDNAFDHTELCLVLQEVILRKISFYISEINSTEDFWSNVLLPTFSTDGNLGFQMVYLLLAISNLEYNIQ